MTRPNSKTRCHSYWKSEKLWKVYGKKCWEWKAETKYELIYISCNLPNIASFQRWVVLTVKEILQAVELKFFGGCPTFTKLQRNAQLSSGLECSDCLQKTKKDNWAFYAKYDLFSVISVFLFCCSCSWRLRGLEEVATKEMLRLTTSPYLIAKLKISE